MGGHKTQLGKAALHALHVLSHCAGVTKNLLLAEALAKAEAPADPPLLIAWARAVALAA